MNAGAGGTGEKYHGNVEAGRTFMHHTSVDHRRHKPLTVLALLAAVALVAGCDSGPPTSPVHGKVTYQGKPVTTGAVTFYPTAGGRPAVGSIQSDGTYTLARKVPGDDVELGDYNVTIEAVEVSNTQVSEEDLITATAVKPKYLVPEKYMTQESSDLTATVTEGDNEINFDLP